MELRVVSRTRILYLTLAAAVALMCATWVGRANAALPGNCPSNGTTALLNFEGGDANFAVDGAATDCYDWLTPDIKTAVTNTNAADGGPSDGGSTVIDVGTIFGVGTKDDDSTDFMASNIVNSNPNAKTDILRAYTYTSFPLFAFGLIRGDGNGTSAYSVEFNQNSQTGSNLPTRLAGDLLFIFDFQANGQAVVKKYTWLTATPGTCAGSGSYPCWGSESTLNAQQAVGKSNLAAFADDPLLAGTQAVPVRTFDELALNLETTLFGSIPAGSCQSFGTVWIRSRLGGSFNSNLSDVVAPQPIHVSNCDVNITKSVTSPTTTPVQLNSTVTYQVAVTLATGSSPIAKDNLTVTDTSSTDPALTNKALVYMSGDTNGNGLLEAGETWLYGIDATTAVSQTADNCPIHNTASVAIVGTDISHTSSDVVTQVDCPADMTITKTASPAGNVRPGDTITYTIAVTRTDQSPVGMNVGTVADSLSATPLVYMSGDTNGDALLDVGETWLYGSSAGTAFSYTVPQSCGMVTNTATVTPGTEQVDGDLTNNSSTVNNDIVCFPDVELVKTADSTTVQPGGVITYTIGVRRTDSDPIGIPVGTVTDVMPNGTLVTLAPLTDANGKIKGDTNGDGLLDPKPAQGAGEMWLYGVNNSPVTYTAPIDSCADIVNNATVVMGAGNDATLANNSGSATVTIDCRPDLGITKVADKATYTVGETIQYTVTVTNTGNLAVPFSQITVADPTLPSLTLQGTAPVLLLPKDTLVYKGSMVTTAANVGQVPNVATVSTPGDSNSTNNKDNVTVTVVAPPAPPVVIAGTPRTTLAIDKTAPANGKLGKAIPYTIKVTNTGSSVANDVVVRDAVPPGLSLVQKPGNAVLSRGVITWNLGTLQPGQSITLTLSMKAGGTKSVRRCNIASATASNADQVSDTACTRLAKVAGQKKPPVVTG